MEIDPFQFKVFVSLVRPSGGDGSLICFFLGGGMGGEAGTNNFGVKGLITPWKLLSFIECWPVGVDLWTILLPNLSCVFYIVLSDLNSSSLEFLEGVSLHWIFWGWDTSLCLDSLIIQACLYLIAYFFE